MFPIVSSILGTLAVISFLNASNGIVLLLALMFSGLFIYNMIGMYITSKLHVVLYLSMFLMVAITVNFFNLITLPIALVSVFLYYLHWNMIQSDELMDDGDGIFALY